MLARVCHWVGSHGVGSRWVGLVLLVTIPTTDRQNLGSQSSVWGRQSPSLVSLRPCFSVPVSASCTREAYC